MVVTRRRSDWVTWALLVINIGVLLLHAGRVWQQTDENTKALESLTKIAGYHETRISVIEARLQVNPPRQERR